MAELINLPWETLLTLACGYAAYYVANTGLREHHRTIDIAFSTLVFGFAAAFVYRLLSNINASILVSSGVAFGSAVLIGAAWRRWGRNWLRWLLRSTKVALSDDLPSAWSAISNVKPNVAATQLAIQLTDGTWLQCDELHRFKDAPNGPCVLGAQGDVLLYVTDTRRPGEESEPNAYVEDEAWGREITYIPASAIARVDLRRQG